MIFSFREWVNNKNSLYFESQKIADYLGKVADVIANTVGKNTVVILGRDAWALVPLLRQRGVKTQYFLYSRLQIGDESTKLAWLREIPRNSYVVDTGFSGSIIDDIRSFDPTTKGLLLSSVGKYPEIRVDGSNVSRKDIVNDIEYIPKLINRTTHYRGHNAIAGEKNRESDVGGRGDPQEIMKQNKDFLKMAGIPDDVADQYKNFSGIPLHQRIGSRDYVTHFMKIEKNRQQQRKEKLKKDWFEKWDIVKRLILKNRPYEWDWHKVPKEVYKFLVYAAHDLNYDIFRSLNHAEQELEKIPKWDKEKIEELTEKIKRRQSRANAIKKIIHPVRHLHYDENDLYDDNIH